MDRFVDLRGAWNFEKEFSKIDRRTKSESEQDSVEKLEWGNSNPK